MLWPKRTETAVNKISPLQCSSCCCSALDLPAISQYFHLWTLSPDFLRKRWNSEHLQFKAKFVCWWSDCCRRAAKCTVKWDSFFSCSDWTLNLIWNVKKNRKKTRERADYFNASQPACYQNLDTKHSCWRCKWYLTHIWHIVLSVLSCRYHLARGMYPVSSPLP